LTQDNETASETVSSMLNLMEQNGITLSDDLIKKTEEQVLASQIKAFNNKMTKNGITLSVELKEKVFKKIEAISLDSQILHD
jgi:DNA-binding protein H-NS